MEAVDPQNPYNSLFLPDACRPAPGTDALITWRALSERSELVRLPYPASVPFDEAGRGVNGFGSFSRKKKTSAAGPKPGIYRTLK
jgi:hypothetical protein